MRYSVGAALVGFGGAALFDGILLHRLLQWHHVAGNRPEPPAAAFWDGVLDAAAFLLVLLGLRILWHHRAVVARISGRCITGLALIGFGLWHLGEGIAVHLVAGLHRIRPAADSPFLWDALWLVAFGILPLLAGLVLKDAPDR
jgi:uncharacterized membrane protein